MDQTKKDNETSKFTRWFRDMLGAACRFSRVPFRAIFSQNRRTVRRNSEEILIASEMEVDEDSYLACLPTDLMVFSNNGTAVTPLKEAGPSKSADDAESVGDANSPPPPPSTPSEDYQDAENYLVCLTPDLIQFSRSPSTQTLSGAPSTIVDEANYPLLQAPASYDDNDDLFELAALPDDIEKLSLFEDPFAEDENIFEDASGEVDGLDSLPPTPTTPYLVQLEKFYFGEFSQRPAPPTPPLVPLRSGDDALLGQPGTTKMKSQEVETVCESQKGGKE